ncbi:hypothetical protein HY837_03545 [archaeon]|nr:hypothetical protein [archaeon]
MNARIWGILLLALSFILLAGGIFCYYIFLIFNITVLGTHKAFFNLGYFLAIIIIILSVLSFFGAIYLFLKKKI